MGLFSMLISMYHWVSTAALRCPLRCFVLYTNSAYYFIAGISSSLLFSNLCTICQNGSKLNEINWCVNIKIMSEPRSKRPREKLALIISIRFIWAKIRLPIRSESLIFFFAKLAELSINSQMLLNKTANLHYCPTYPHTKSPFLLSSTMTFRFTWNRSHSTAMELIVRYNKRQPVRCKFICTSMYPLPQWSEPQNTTGFQNPKWTINYSVYTELNWILNYNYCSLLSNRL